MAVPNTVVYFTSYDQVKRRLGFVNGEQNSKLIPFVSGATARGEFNRNSCVNKCYLLYSHTVLMDIAYIHYC